MANPSRGHCSNRDVVNVDNRLYSPRYDFQGDEGLAWHEIGPADAMCFFGMCGHESYNAWVKATDQYISETLVPHYKKILSRAEAVYGGAALPIELTDAFNKVEETVSGWNSADYRPNKTFADEFSHPLRAYWRGEIKGIIDYYDAAACSFDDLDRLAIENLKQPSIAKGAPARQLEHVEGGYLGGRGGPGGTTPPPSSNWARALGIVAIGAAGYFGYKVLTE